MLIALRSARRCALTSEIPLLQEELARAEESKNVHLLEKKMAAMKQVSRKPTKQSRCTFGHKRDRQTP
eukprot:711143-Pyramimonas_sp.AAC.1